MKIFAIITLTNSRQVVWSSWCLNMQTRVLQLLSSSLWWKRNVLPVLLVSTFRQLIWTLGNNESFCQNYADKFKAGSVIFMMHFSLQTPVFAVIVVFTLNIIQSEGCGVTTAATIETTQGMCCCGKSPKDVRADRPSFHSVWRTRVTKDIFAKWAFAMWAKLCKILALKELTYSDFAGKRDRQTDRQRQRQGQRKILS